MPRVEAFNREQVLQRAMNLFWEKGYYGTSMQDLVDATGLNRSSLYNTFGSKLTLYQDTLAHYKKETGGMFQRALVRARDPLDAIRHVFEGFLPEIMEDCGQMGCFAMNCKSEMANQNTDIKKWLLDHQEQGIHTFKDLIEDGQKEGVINDKQEASSYAYFVFNALQGFRMTGILVKDRKILQDIIDNTMKVLQ